jgi:hypothetical protein
VLPLELVVVSTGPVLARANEQDQLVGVELRGRIGEPGALEKPDLLVGASRWNDAFPSMKAPIGSGPSRTMLPLSSMRT